MLLLQELLIHYGSHQKLAKSLNITLPTLIELLNNEISPTNTLQTKIKQLATNLRIIK
jgi:hypothetical protein